MSPEPYVRGQALVLGALLVAAAVLGSPPAALVCAVVTALCAWALRARYRGDVALARAEVPPHRERLDLIVAGDARAALAAGLVASGLLVGFPVRRPDAGVAPATFVLLAVTAAGIFLSSLVDWYVILPRISGLLGVRPCRHPDGDLPRFPDTWRETTRWWYVHRIAAALLLRFGLAYAVVLTVRQHVSLPGGASVVGGAAAGSFAAYLAAVPSAVWQAGHPAMIVGRTIRRRTVGRAPRSMTVLGRRIRLPLPKRRTVGPWRAREYVYDVALESVQLAPVAARERQAPLDEHGRVRYERDPAKLAVQDVAASTPEPADEPYAGCRERCCGINWYCIENPRCFDPK